MVFALRVKTDWGEGGVVIIGPPSPGIGLNEIDAVGV